MNVSSKDKLTKFLILAVIPARLMTENPHDRLLHQILKLTSWAPQPTLKSTIQHLFTTSWEEIYLGVLAFAVLNLSSTKIPASLYKPYT